jgi:urease accessory protein
VLRDGDLLSGEGGRVVRVVAAPEPTYLVRCATPPCWRAAPSTSATATPRPRSAPGWMRIRVDPVLKEMVLGLGAQVDEELAKFEPEPGAYAAATARTHGTARPPSLLAPVPLRQKIHRPGDAVGGAEE